MTTRRLRSIALFCIVGLSTLGAKCPLARKTRAKPAVAIKSTLPDSADQVIFGFRALLHDQGISKGLLLSDQATSYEDGSRLELNRVNLTFYTALGDKDGVLTSRTGSYSTRLELLEARGDVIVKRDDGRTLTSPHLVYDKRRNQIFTDSAFTFVQPSGQLSGIGFESDPRLTLFKCHAACKGVAPVQIPTK